MKRLTLLLASTALLTACLEFDDALDAGCANGASWDVCQAMPVGGGGSEPMDAGDTDAGEQDAGQQDAGHDEDAGSDAGQPEEDAGFDAGMPITDAGVRDCIGRGGFCWENPKLGGMTYRAVWGTSDSDVYVAGGGGMVLHFDGTKWSQSLLTTQTVGRELVRAGVTTGDGRHWLCGDSMMALGAEGLPDAAVAVPAFQVACNFADQLDDRIAFLRTDFGSTDGVLVLSGDGGVSSYALPPVGSDAGNVYRRMLVALDGDGGVVVVETGDLGDLLVTPNSRQQLLNPDGGRLITGMQALRRTNRGDVAVLSSSSTSTHLARSTASGWDATWVVRDGLLWDFLTDTLDDGGVRWWFTGRQDALGYTTENQPLVLPTVSNTYDSFTNFALWLSPQKTVWAVGEGGRVQRWERDAGSPSTMTHRPQHTVNDVAFAGNRALAVGAYGSTWSRNGDVWTYTLGSDVMALGVAALPDAGFARLDSRGVVRMGSQSFALLDAGYPSFERVGGMQTGGDGRVWAALGSRLGEYIPATDTWARHQLTGNGFNSAIDLAVADDGTVWVASNQMNGDYDFSNVGGAFRVKSTDAGVVIDAVSVGMSVRSVTRKPGGGAYVAGLYSLFDCPTTGTICDSIAYPFSEGAPVAVLTDKNDRLWVMDRNGLLWFHLGGDDWSRSKRPGAAAPMWTTRPRAFAATTPTCSCSVASAEFSAGHSEKRGTVRCR